MPFLRFNTQHSTLNFQVSRKEGTRNNHLDLIKDKALEHLVLSVQGVIPMKNFLYPNLPYNVVVRIIVTY